jgi:hypothetical protein
VLIETVFVIGVDIIQSVTIRESSIHLLVIEFDSGEIQGIAARVEEIRSVFSSDLGWLNDK